MGPRPLRGRGPIPSWGRPFVDVLSHRRECGAAQWLWSSAGRVKDSLVCAPHARRPSTTPFHSGAACMESTRTFGREGGRSTVPAERSEAVPLARPDVRCRSALAPCWASRTARAVSTGITACGTADADHLGVREHSRTMRLMANPTRPLGLLCSSPATMRSGLSVVEALTAHHCASGKRWCWRTGRPKGASSRSCKAASTLLQSTSGE